MLGLLARRGYDVRILDWSDPKRSIGFNPITRAYSSSEINRVATLMVETSLTGSGDRFWNLQAISLLNLLIRVVKIQDEDKQNLSHIRELLLQFSGNPDNFEETITATQDQGIITEYHSFKAFGDKMRLGIIASVLSALQLFGDKDLTQVTQYDSLASRNLPGEENGALCYQ